MSVKTVAPMNVGKGIKWNSGSKQYDVNVASNTLQVNSNNELEVKVSKQSGNMIEARSDGLYYGTVAPVNIAHLYVDAVAGIDQDPDVVEGAGTRAKPLKTVQYAVKLGTAGINRYIHIKEKQTHLLTERQIPLRGGNISFEVYGEVLDAIALPQYSGNGKWVNDDYFTNIPTLKIDPSLFRAEADNTLAFANLNCAAFVFQQNTTVIFDGICLDMTDIPVERLRQEWIALRNASSDPSSFRLYPNTFSSFMRAGNCTVNIRFNGCKLKSSICKFEDQQCKFSLIGMNGTSGAISSYYSTFESDGQLFYNNTNVSYTQPTNTARAVVTKANAKQLIAGVTANEYAYLNFTTNLPIDYFK